MSEMDVCIRNMSGDPDNFFSRLYEFGGMGILRCGDTFQFLFLCEESGYIVYTHDAGLGCLRKVKLTGGSRSAELFEQLAERADQLYHASAFPDLERYGVMLGVEQTILSSLPCANALRDMMQCN